MNPDRTWVLMRSPEFADKTVEWEGYLLQAQEELSEAMRGNSSSIQALAKFEYIIIGHLMSILNDPSVTTLLVLKKKLVKV